MSRGCSGDLLEELARGRAWVEAVAAVMPGRGATVAEKRASGRS